MVATSIRVGQNGRLKPQPHRAVADSSSTWLNPVKLGTLDSGLSLKLVPA